MGEQPAVIGGLALSVQDEGETIGLHIEMPGSAYAVKFPIDYVETLERELPGMLRTALEEAARMRSGIVTPPTGGKLEIVKGN